MKRGILSSICVLSVLCGTVHARQVDALSVRQQDIVAIASYTGNGDWAGLKISLARGFDDSMTVHEIEEVLAHACAYCGFPRNLRTLQTFASVSDERRVPGVADVVGREALPVADKRDKYTCGSEILSRMSGVPADASQADYAEFAPVIERYLKEHLSCDIFERDVLNGQERELAAASILAATGGVEPMARGRMGVCLPQGITASRVHELLDIMAKHINRGKAGSVCRVLNEMTDD